MTGICSYLPYMSVHRCVVKLTAVAAVPRLTLELCQPGLYHGDVQFVFW